MPSVQISNFQFQT